MTLYQLLELLHSLSSPDALIAVLGIANSFIVQYFPGLRNAKGGLKLWAMIGLSFGIPIGAAIIELILWYVNALAVVDATVIANNLVAAAIAGLLTMFTGTGFYHLTFRDARRPGA